MVNSTVKLQYEVSIPTSLSNSIMDDVTITNRERERGREGEKEGGNEGEREGAREGEKEGGNEGEREEQGREGGGGTLQIRGL